MRNRFLLAGIQILWHSVDIIAAITKVVRRISLTTLIAVVFVVGASVFNLFRLGGVYQPSHTPSSGTSLLIEAALANATLPEIGISGASFAIAENDEDAVGFVMVDSASVLNVNSPLSNIVANRDGLLTYKIKEGDNLSSIAAQFGISLNTILWANDGLRANLIRAGQEIVILPVSGVLHPVQEGETLESIAHLYDVPITQILKFNDSSAATFIIPGAKPQKTSTVFSSSNLPDLRGYFVIPTTGWNWGRLHGTNAIDIANACGTPVYAAAEGLVVAARSIGWNSGYGNYIDIEHPNGAATRYAHNQKNIVSDGDYVLQGDHIAYIGNTGNTHGPTGCHLHFEVRGAKNPFAK